MNIVIIKTTQVLSDKYATFVYNPMIVMYNSVYA